MPLRSITFLLYFLGSSAAALALPMIGVVCYIVLYHVYPQTTWWGSPLESFGLRYSYIIGLSIIIGTVLNIHTLRFGRNLLHPVEWGMVAVFATMLVSAGLADYQSHLTFLLIDKMTKVFVFAFLLSRIAVGRKQLNALAILLMLMVLYLGHEAKVAPSGSFVRNRLNGIGGPDFREAAGLAIHLLALMPFVAICLKAKTWWVRIAAFFAGCYGVNAVLLCRARSAFLAALIAGVLTLWYIPKRHRQWAVFALVLAAIGGFILSDEYFWDRMETIVVEGEERDTSAASRLVIWSAAWEMLKDNPLGVGVGDFSYYIARYSDDADVDILKRDAHNSFILCAGETGWPGIIALLATIALAWRTLGRLGRAVRTRLPDPEFYSMLIYASRMAIVIYCVAGMFVSRFYTEGFWWFLILPVCIARAVENEIAAQTRREAEAVKALNREFADGESDLPLLLTGGRPV